MKKRWIFLISLAVLVVVVSVGILCHFDENLLAALTTIIVVAPFIISIVVKRKEDVL